MLFKGKYNHIILLSQVTQNRSEQLGYEKTIMKKTEDNNVNRRMINVHGLLSYQDIED